MKRYFDYLCRVARFRRDALNLHPPILVHQMGKVGSTTVYRSLKASKLPNPIYHLHHLSRDGIKRARDRLDETPAYRRPRHVHTSIFIRRRIDRGHKAWMVITLLRDSVARAVSDLFQNARTFYPEVLDDHGNVQPHQVVDRLRTMFSNLDENTDYVCTWFDREVWPVFGIDVFAVPFGRERGYQIYESERAKLLVVRLEDLNVRFEEALSEFLPGSCHVPIVREISER